MGKQKTRKTTRRKRTLTPAELRVLREIEPDPARQALFREMVEEGDLELPSESFDLKAFLRYRPIKVKGKPISETIIEERR